MKFIPQAEIERLKREVSVQRLAEVRGIKLKRTGKQLMGLCPFHNDTSPSLSIDPVKNEWHCFGACNEGGDVILWVMRSERVSFRHAAELLRKDAPITGVRAAVRSQIRKLPSPIAPEQDDRTLLQRIAGYYQHTLKQEPLAQQYLLKRGLESSEMMERFKLGYANRTLGYHLHSYDSTLGKQERERLRERGILRQETGHEHFNGCVVFPILNLAGEVVQMYGRKIGANLHRSVVRHLYLPGPHCGVWNEEALLASKEIILCEAIIDALTFWCAGYRHVTSIYGVNGFTDELRAAFEKHGTRRIYLAYDRDEAGEKAAQKHAEELMSLGIECFRVQFPKGMDANEYARTTKPAAKALSVLLNRAEWLGKGKRPVTNVIALPAAPAVPKSIEEETIKPAAKKENSLPAPTTANAQPALPLVSAATPEPVKTMPALRAEKVFSFAAASVSVPHEEAAPPALPTVEEAALPLPSATGRVLEIPTEIKDEEVLITLGERRYRVRGLQKNMSYELLRVNVLVSSTNERGSGFHVDTLDLYAARQRGVFVKQAAEELGVKEEIIHRDLGRVLLKLEELQDRQIKQALEPEDSKAAMTQADEAAALELLRDPHLMTRVLADFERCGVVGEETNKKVSYLAAVSRLLQKPLAVVVQSASAAGKSSLMEAVLDFMPEEQREEYSAMTGQALYYMGEKNLKHKILAVSEEEGASRAAYALKLLQSEGILKIASTGKDPVSGKLVTHEYIVEGPVMIFLTTTAQDVDEELMNRCVVLTVDEEREQTRAIHRKQREARTLEGHWAQRKRAEVVKLHRNAQRLLRPLTVVNNHDANAFPDHLTRTRRDHAKLLTLIEAIALLHQHQREIKRDTREGETLEYIEATAEDVKLAEALVSQVVRPSLDELPPHTRRLLSLIEEMAAAECERLQVESPDYHFTRRMVREYTRWGDTQVRLHMKRLEEMEYLVVKRGGPGMTFVYQLRCNYDPNCAGVEGHCAGGARVPRGGGENEESSMNMGTKPTTARNPENAYKGQEHKNGVVGGPPPKPNGAARANGAAHAEVF